MKINPNGLHESQLEGSARARRTDLAGPDLDRSDASRQRQVGLDRVEVSEVAETAAEVLTLAGEQRAERVGKLKAQYDARQYTVDPNRLAGRIIDEDTSSEF